MAQDKIKLLGYCCLDWNWVDVWDDGAVLKNLLNRMTSYPLAAQHDIQELY